MNETIEMVVTETSKAIALVIQGVAVLVVTVGVAKTLVGVVRVALHGRLASYEFRAIWLEFARWLVAGLTVQLAADIVQTSIGPTWDELGRLAAIAAVRTFLSYFLDRELDTMRGHEPQTASAAPSAPS